MKKRKLIFIYIFSNIKIINIFSFLLILILIVLNIFLNKDKPIFYIFKRNFFDINFEYHNYQKDYINQKMIEKSEWLLSPNDAYFINGLIRKLKPKNCLEVGVARGGSAVIILNAIKDIQDSVLVSMELNDKLFIDKSKETGYTVKEFFPELTKNWKLFTGDQPISFWIN